MITIDELEKYLWDSAVILRGLIDAASYKEYIFPLVFFKRISDVYDEEYQKHYDEAIAMGSTKEDATEYALDQMKDSSIQIPDGAHWKDVFNITEDLGQKLKEALHVIERANPAKEVDGRFVGGLHDVFGDKNIWTNKTKMPDTTIRALLNHYNSRVLNLAECPADEMGTGYEYLIGQFADDAGHTAQEFYTNRTVVELMAEILQLQSGESIYDPTCGSGGMLIKSLTYLKDKGQEWRDVKVYGQELNADTSAIARMNCYLHGVHEFQIVNDDTLERPAFIKNGKVQQFDVVLANPPYSLSMATHKQFEHDKYGRNFLGNPPESCADYAFIQHILASMDEKTGRCAILLPLGLLSKDIEQSMRTKLIESDLIEAIIGLGPNLFFNSPMEAMILVCNTHKSEKLKNKVLFINAVKEVVRKNGESKLEHRHIEKICKAYFGQQNIEHFSKIIDNEQLLNNKANLTISLYVMPEIIRDAVLPLNESFEEWNVACSSVNKNMESLINML